MKVVTRSMVEQIGVGETYTLPEGWILSPGAQSLLRERRAGVRIPPRRMRVVSTPVPAQPGGGYLDDGTGRPVGQKAEEMTQLAGNRLVRKDHPRIRFRGSLDSLQARIVTAQVLLEERGAQEELVEAMEEILAFLRQVLRAEVLDEPLPAIRLLGLEDGELRRQSHDPQKYFGVAPMVLPHRSMGLCYALLNELRGAVREGETWAVAAFGERPTPAQRDILRAMNRLSSVFHILMCRVLAGRYGA